MVALYKDPEGKDIFSAQEKHDSQSLQMQSAREDRKQSGANTTVETLRMRITELETKLSESYKQAGIVVAGCS